MQNLNWQLYNNIICQNYVINSLIRVNAWNCFIINSLIRVNAWNCFSENHVD